MKLATALLTCVFAVITHASLRGQDAMVSRVLDQSFLYRAQDSTVWIGQPLVSLGMIGVSAHPPLYRLSPELVQRMSSLVNELQEAPEHPLFWWFELPPVKNAESPFVLVRLQLKAELEKTESSGAVDGDRGDDARNRSVVYQVTSLELVYAEFISAPWRRAWRSLNSHFAKIVSISRTAPGNSKHAQLAEAIEQASRDLNAMVASKVDDRSREIVRRIEPRARVVRLFQRRVESSSPGNWGGQLRQYVNTLRIQPRTPLPLRDNPCPILELFSNSESPSDFLEKIRASWPESTLEERVIFSNREGTLFAWQAEYLTAAQFDTLRSQARQELAEQQEQSSNQNRVPEALSKQISVPQWNIVLEEASPDVLAENGLLKGLVVRSIFDATAARGLQRGDVIINYGSTYDLVMGGLFSPARQFENLAQYGGTLDVIRDGQLISLIIKGRQ